MLNQSTAVVNISEGRSPGLYGYINGEYLDGTGWTPEPGYEPKTRPWYIDARASIGRVAVVDPYLDLDSSTIMIALSKTLCDARSVAALDFSLDHLQNMTEELTQKDHMEMEIVMDRKYQVITHSDRSEVGKNYLYDDEGFGHALVQKMRYTDEDYFSMRYDNKSYIVYSSTVADDWKCVSVFDATSSFAQLWRMLFITIVSAIFVIGIQVVILRKLNKKELQARQAHEETQRAIAASEAKSAFLSNMSHEIRTPINAVLGMNEMILRESTEEGVLEYAQSVRTAGTTLLGLINDILDFSKIEAGKMEIIPVEYDISSLINDLVNMIQTKADGKGLELLLDIKEDIPKILFGDEVRIKQIVTNILTNAVKYTEEGSVTFSVSHEALVDDNENTELIFSVSDTGIGIKPEDMGKLFSEFDRIEEERNRTVEGTGLGMTITKRLLEMMGSSLQVESVYGEGSVFSFRLKQKVAKWDPLGDYETAYRQSLTEHKTYREKFTAPDVRVLVIDDTVTNLTVFKNLLKRTKIQIDTAESGDAGLALTRENKYDMIFFDHMMPVKDGIETFHELRDEADNPNVAATSICLTANAISGAREKYLSEGFDDYLTKPIDAEKLEEMLIQYLPEEKVRIMDASETSEEELEEALPDWLLECEGLDTDEGVKNSGGTEGYMTVLTGFYAAINEKADEIQGYYDSGDNENFTVKVHALKSSARIIGAAELSEKARLLEAAGKEGDTGYINENTEDMLRLYRSYRDILSPIDAASEDLPEIPADTLEEAYEAVAEFTEAQDYECVRMVLDSLKEFGLAAPDKDRFDSIQAKLSQMDWDGIKEILNG
ncbi:MAG: response regulator [Lachnospiraceae bacterium]|nr:response regulator [Lachnospiraceae bacterium]